MSDSRRFSPSESSFKTGFNGNRNVQGGRSRRVPSFGAILDRSSGDPMIAFPSGGGNVAGDQLPKLAGWVI